VEDKTILTLVALILLTIIQIVAWLLGFDGQITIFVTSAFTALLGFFTGINFTMRYSANQH